MGKREPVYTEEFKRQIVELKQGGGSVNEIQREYKISKTAIRNWIREIGKSGKFGVLPNQSEEEKELRQLRKEVKHLRMENDILKQAALILGRKEV